MILGKIKSVAIVEFYDNKGGYLGKRANYNYQPLITWFDLIVGLSVAFVVATQIFN